jgi:hypothetical protein
VIRITTCPAISQNSGTGGTRFPIAVSKVPKAAWYTSGHRGREDYEISEAIALPGYELYGVALRADQEIAGRSDPECRVDAEGNAGGRHFALHRRRALLPLRLSRGGRHEAGRRRAGALRTSRHKRCARDPRMNRKSWFPPGRNCFGANHKRAGEFRAFPVIVCVASVQLHHAIANGATSS